jgi:hypothetical protein
VLLVKAATLQHKLKALQKELNTWQYVATVTALSKYLFVFVSCALIPQTKGSLTPPYFLLIWYLLGLSSS